MVLESSEGSAMFPFLIATNTTWVLTHRLLLPKLALLSNIHKQDRKTLGTLGFWLSVATNSIIQQRVAHVCTAPLSLGRAGVTSRAVRTSRG